MYLTGIEEQLALQEDLELANKEWQKLIAENSLFSDISKEDKMSFKLIFIAGFLAGLNHKDTQSNE